MNQRESQLKEEMRMKIKTNLCAQSKQSTLLSETIDSGAMTFGRSFRLLSTEKLIPRSTSQKLPLAPHFTIKTDRIDSNVTVTGLSYRQQPTKIDFKTIK
ncbi:MAG: hypothetical protein EZS28_039664, partial [Streblomastix strix]